MEDIVYPGIGHAYSEAMVRDVTRWIGGVVAGAAGGSRGEGGSKI